MLACTHKGDDNNVGVPQLSTVENMVVGQIIFSH